MPDISQTELIEKINACRRTYDSEELSRKGFCHGFAIVHSYMAATGKLDWWYAALGALALWDGKKESLSTEVTLPDADPGEKDKTLGHLLERVIGYVLYNHADVKVTGIHYNQTDFLKIGDAFFSKEGVITKKTDAAGFMDADTLKQLLMQSFFEQQNAIFLIESLYHTCSIRFDSKTKTWRFYNPNYQTGEKSFKKVDGLIKEIHRQLGQSLHITAASWNPKFETNPFEDKVKKLTNDSAIKLLNEFGLHLIAQWAPDQLADILALAKDHEYIRPSLAYALRAQVDGSGSTALHKIAHYAPDQLAELIKLADNHAHIREALADALKIKNKDKWTGLHVIANKAPNQLAILIKLAENHDEIREALTHALKITNKDGWTGLHMIAGYAPDQLPILIKLAGNHDEIREALAHALNMKNIDGWTGLHMIAKKAPNQLASIFTLAEKHNDVLFSLVSALKAQNNMGTGAMDTIIEHSQEDLLTCEKLIKLVKDIGTIRLGHMSKLIKELDIYIAKKTPKQSGAGGNAVKKTGAEKLKQYLLDVRTGNKDLDSALKDIQSILKDESNKKGIFKKWSMNLNPNNFFVKKGVIKPEGDLESFYLRAQTILSGTAELSQKFVG